MVELWEGIGSWYYVAQGICWGIIVAVIYEVGRKKNKENNNK